MPRIGVDVGGTNTDAVLMDGTTVLAAYKTSTTEDVGQGILRAIQGVLADGPHTPADVTAVMIGTTHFVNAVVERKRLLRSAVIRLALPAAAGLPPLTGWPPDLRAAIGDHVYMARGGYNYDGRKISPLDEDELRAIAADLERKEIRSVAITSVFAPLDGEMEQQAAEILRDALPDLFVTLGGEIGRIGLLERENAAAINACLRGASRHAIGAMGDALAAAGVDAPLYISQNDGTLMSKEWAEAYPVLTFASGPTNSMRGAALLSAAPDAIVVDIGGTTADVGALANGFPREASAEVEVAGVQTNFRMPDVLSLGLGGGSIVRGDASDVTIGPDSVGYELTQRALVFGGDTLTATDIAVAAGYAQLGDPAKVAHLPAELVEAAVERIHRTVEDAIDRMKTQAGATRVVLVGGGSILVSRELAGASETLTPERASVANAIGAAIGQISGEVDQILSFEAKTREMVREEVSATAVEKAVAAGAEPGTVEVVDFEEVPLTYMAGASVSRFRVKAVGDLVLGAAKASA
ncbi:MAG TPA: hydantoinase/oxoprolinase family protein [Conexibacter sp.]|nr:hydantoinase/oxoprolinase family protein [Conexibacter sp.]